MELTECRPVLSANANGVLGAGGMYTAARNASSMYLHSHSKTER